MAAILGGPVMGGLADGGGLTVSPVPLLEPGGMASILMHTLCISNCLQLGVKQALKTTRTKGDLVEELQLFCRPLLSPVQVS